MTDYTPEFTPGPWRVEKPEDDLIKWQNHAIGARPTISIWADSTQKELYHEIALVAHDDLANAELIASAPRLKEEHAELLELVSRFADSVNMDDNWGKLIALALEARELIAKVEK